MEWKPNKRQEDALKVPDTVFELLYGGAAGGGKTDFLLWLPVVREFHQHPRYKGMTFRRTFPELESEIIQRAHQIYPLFGGRYNEKYHRYVFPSGAIEQFGHCEHDVDIRKYDTAEYQCVRFDELTSFNRFPYTYFIGSRMRSVASLPMIVRSGTNPGNTGHKWVFKRFIEKAPHGYKILRDPISTLQRIFIPALVTDNTALMEADPGYVNKLKLLAAVSQAEYKAKALGSWDAFEGQVFDEFRIRPEAGEPENACHVIEGFDIPEWWPRILTIDWGFKAFTWAGWLAIAPTGRVYLYQEYAAKKTRIAEWASDIARMSTGAELVDIVMCPSAWQDRGDPKTIAIQFAEVFGRMPRKADQDRISGKMLLHEMLRWKPRPKKYRDPSGFSQEQLEFIFRKYGHKAAKNYMDSFQDEPEEDNIPRLQIFEKCKEVISAIQACVYNERKIEDVAEFEGDDPYDGLRYGIKAVDHYVTTAQREFTKLHQTSHIMEKFEATQDFNYLHRAMEQFEHQNHHSTYGVYRSSRMRHMRRSKRIA